MIFYVYGARAYQIIPSNFNLMRTQNKQLINRSHSRKLMKIYHYLPIAQFKTTQTAPDFTNWKTYTSI